MPLNYILFLPERIYFPASVIPFNTYDSLILYKIMNQSIDDAFNILSIPILHMTRKRVNPWHLHCVVCLMRYDVAIYDKKTMLMIVNVKPMTLMMVNVNETVLMAVNVKQTLLMRVKVKQTMLITVNVNVNNS